MSHENEQPLDAQLGQRLFSASSTSACDDEVEALNSSTSTAGPDGLPKKNLQRCSFWETDSGNSVNTNNTSQRWVHEHSDTLKLTGSYRAMPSGARHSASTGKRRSFSNTSTVVSLVGSVPEWGRSFCVFNPMRVLPRQSVSPSQQRFGSKGGGINSAGTSSPSCSSPAAAVATHGFEHHKSSNLFATSPGISVGFGADCGIGRNFSTATCATGYLSSLSGSGSPLLGASRSGRHAAAMCLQSSYAASTHYAMGYPASISPARKRLPMLLSSFCCYLALTGKPIISGTYDRPLDIRKGPLIGVGGFAKVYAGVDCISGELVSIKEVNIADIDNQKSMSTISREFASLRSLQHPNIVSYHFFEHSASQKMCRIVMELLTGGSALFLLEKYGPLNECVLRNFTRHLLQAIAFIHGKGILHLDIKPANILISDKGVVKLCDFGCSKRLNELSKSTNCVFGTPLYMAPELIKGRANHKSDIWSMGCSLFELATGLLPWYHTNILEHIRIIFYITSTSESPLVLPKEKSQNFSPAFLNFMELCFIRDVNKRPEAIELLNHPWITGQCAKKLDNDFPSFSGYNCSHSLSLFSASNIASEELGCQQEIEDAAAIISAEMCNTWMSLGGGGVVTHARHHIQQQQQQQPPQLPVDGRNRNDDVAASQHHHDNWQVELHGLLGNSSRCNSPAVKFRGAGGLPSISPTISVETLQHDSFNYTIPCGASEGRFMLPSCSSVSISPAAPQYLRINSDGCLDVVSAEEDIVKVDGDVDDALTASFRQQFPRSPSFNYLLRSTSPIVKGGGSSSNAGVAAQPLAGYARHNNNNNNNNNNNSNSNSVSAVSGGKSPGGCYTRHVSLTYNPSMSLMSNSSFTSRGVSPSRRSQTALTGSLTASQQLPSLLPMNGSASAFAGASMTHSTEDVTAEGQGTVQSTSFVSRISEGINCDPSGRLLMSFSVPVGHPDRQVNVEISVDPEDVQCKLIERRPSLVVAFSEDVRAQITAKMGEVAPESESDTPETYRHADSNHLGTCVFGALNRNSSKP